LAQQGSHQFVFPEPEVPGLNFSFSGLKTAVLYFLRKEKAKNPDFVAEHLADICTSLQNTIVKILLKKLRKAARQTGIKEIAVAGGVSANSGLRRELMELGTREGWNTYIPAFQYCTDNAGMIGIAAYYQYLNNDFAGYDAAPYARQ